MKRFLFIGVAAGAMQAGMALAQDSGSETQSAEALIRLAAADQITVYATRSPIPAFDYPGQVTVVDRDAIDDFNPSTISDVFDAVPGAQFDSGPRRTGDSPGIRGLSGEGVLVLFDGARQSFLSGHDGRFFVDPDLVQAVEVVRGPTSALYGSGALGGVIALRTVTAEDLLDEDETGAIKFSAGYQSVNEEWRGGATGAWRTANGIFDVVGNLTYRDSSDIELGNDLDLPADDELLSSLLKATVRPSDDLTFSASWIRFDGESVDPNNPQGANTANPGNENVDRNIDSNTVQGLVNYAPANTNLVDLNIVGYWTQNEVEEAVIDSERVITRDVETVGVSIDNRSKFALGDAANLTFTYGGEYYRDKQIGRDNTTTDGARGGVPDAEGKFYGAFVQAELALERPIGAPGVLTFIPGVRWDKFENEAPGEPSTEDEAVSPKVGVSYKPAPELILFGSWAEAFRAPSFNEVYSDGVHFRIPNLSVPGPFGPFGPPAFVTNFFISNPDLVAEESETWEVGAGVDLDGVLLEGDSFTAKGSYYQSDVTNLIDLDVNIPFTCFLTPGDVLPFFPPCGSGEPFGNTSQNVNVTNAEIEGFELEGYYDSDYFYARANFSTIDGRDIDTGDFVGVLTPDIFFIDAGVKAPGTDIRFGGRVTIAGDLESVNSPTLRRESYVVGDLYFVWQPESGPLEGLRLDLGVDNVADTDYEVVAAGVSQPGRNLKAAVSWRQGF